MTTLNRAHQISENNKAKYKDDSNPKPYVSSPVGTIFIIKEQRLQKIRAGNTWFLDSCVFHHLYNNWKLFSKLKAKGIDFVTAVGQVIWIEKVGTISIWLANGNKIELQNITLAPGCNSNLIFFSQLQETGITFYDNPTVMTWMRNRKVIAQAKKDQNLFTSELAHPRKAMAMTI